MEEITRQQVPRWNAALAQKQLAAIAMLRGGHNFKAVICCLSLSVTFLMASSLVAWSSCDDFTTDRYSFVYPNSLVFCVAGSFVLTSIALGAWIPAANTLAPAFGGYDGGQPGASLYLVVSSIVLMVCVFGSELWMRRGRAREEQRERERAREEQRERDERERRETEQRAHELIIGQLFEDGPPREVCDKPKDSSSSASAAPAEDAPLDTDPQLQTSLALTDEEKAEAAVFAMDPSEKSVICARLPPGRWEAMTWVERLACLKSGGASAASSASAELVIDSIDPTADTEEEKARKNVLAIPVAVRMPLAKHPNWGAMTWIERLQLLNETMPSGGKEGAGMGTDMSDALQQAWTAQANAGTPAGAYRNATPIYSQAGMA
eukprot:Tamp_11626.p1 GENE.Tamp_11626~~Tamp_11626.p1  ORF type:complete len:378 (+),score=51.12 Tamp_11626:566-1699(+)